MRRPLAALLLLLAPPALAQPQPMPVCAAQREGMTTCMAEKLCLCRFDAGGTLTGRPSGYRWDCGALRPACGVVPPDTNPVPQQPMMVQPFVQPNWSGPQPR